MGVEEIVPNGFNIITFHRIPFVPSCSVVASLPFHVLLLMMFLYLYIVQYPTEVVGDNPGPGSI